MLNSQINNGAPRVLVETERGVRAAASAQCNLYFIRHNFEGANPFLAFPFRRGDALRAKFDEVLGENSDKIARIANK